jgi:lipoprotein-anchoring transpeptidase ErfK/SrfK
VGNTAAQVTRGERQLWVRRGRKRVALSLRAQQLRAWEGDRLVLQTHISSGRKGMDTPKGTYRAGPLKSRMVISRKYGDAEMPWSVQVHRNIFIHGFPSVPPRAASHGCIRMPLTGGNPARWFYEWVTIGTPIEIGDEWPLEKTE